MNPNPLFTDTLYFGLLQLDITCDQRIPWREEELRFSHADLAPARRVFVSISFVDDIETSPIESETDSTLIMHSPVMDVYQAGRQEYRFYYSSTSRTQSPFAYSVGACAQTDNVSIYIRKINGDCILPDRSLLYYMHIEKLLLDADALLLHSCYMEYQGRAILLTAPSGTGKTTHSLLWKHLFGTRTVNGDRTLIQRVGEDYYACGFFFHGSAPECENEHFPLDTIVIIRQSEQDYLEEVKPARKFLLLFSECTINDFVPARVEAASSLLEDLLARVRVVVLHCTMNNSAAYLLKEYIDSHGTV